MKQLLSMLLMLLGLGFGSSGLAMPESFQALEHIDLAGKSITLEGQTYRLAEDVRWFGLGDRRPEDVLPVMRGRRLGVEIDYSGGQPVVTEVWVQP